VVVCLYRGSSEYVATLLRAALSAGQAASTLVHALGLQSGRVVSAVRGLVELLPWEPGRRAALCAVSCRNGALNRVLDLVRVINCRSFSSCGLLSSCVPDADSAFHSQELLGHRNVILPTQAVACARQCTSLVGQRC